MTTLAHEVTWWTARQWEKLYKSAIVSGIAPDRKHLSAGGPHVSIEDNPKNNYSVRRPDDKAPPGKWPRDLSAAIDMSMGPADMRLCTARLKRVFDNPDDPRRKYLNAFNGWLGTGDAQRFDIAARVVSWATPDHKWHVHLEMRRRWVTSWDAARAVVSALKGETIAQYNASLKPAPAKPAPVKTVPVAHKAPAKATPTPRGGDVSWDDDVIPVAGDPKNPTWKAANALGHVTVLARAMNPRVTQIEKTTTKLLAEMAALRSGQATLIAAINKLAGGQQLNTAEVLTALRDGAYKAVKDVAGEAVADSMRIAADAVDPPAA